jgi:heat shock protein HtpX
VGSFYGQQGLIFALIFGGLTNIFAWFYSDKIAIATMRGQEVPADAAGVPGELYHLVDELRQRAGLPMPRVYICPQPAPNAFATGRSPSHAAVAVTQGALQVLSLDELRGVIGHELSHVKNRDTLTTAIAATVAGVLAYIATWGWLLGGRSRDANPILMLLTIIFAPIAAAIIQATISRSREYVADADGAAIAGSPDGLISALQKLDAYAHRVPMQNPNPAQNSMFIVQPFTGRSIMNMFATHPPMENRILALRKLGAKMSGTAYYG